MKSKKDYKRIVVKTGSSFITAPSGKIELKYLHRVVDQIAALSRDKKEVILVTSGAIACGMDLLGLSRRPTKLDDLQAVASIGQGRLMSIYAEAFSSKKLICAQILLTWDDFDRRQRYLNARNTILNLLSRGVVPVINENDAVASEEIKFGDNDKLSAYVASLVSADLLVMLSDVDGLYNLDGELEPMVTEITPQLKKLACGTEKETCVGGMYTKLEAAAIATGASIPSIIASGKTEDVLIKIINNENIGTIFLPKAKQLLAKQRWIAFGAKPKGKVFVDDGAKEALVKKSKSLLCVGILKIEGQFKIGETVSLCDTNNREFARGLAGCASNELEKIKGTRYHKEIIHRNNLVIL